METKHDLIKALLIVEKYNSNFKLCCSHDLLSICGVEPQEVSEEDKTLLNDYGFFISDESGEDSFESFRWGSC